MDLHERAAEQPLPDLKPGGLNWRSMAPADLDGVVEVARLSFPDHFESRDCFENRLTLNPSGCFVLAGPDQTVRGYLVAYPWRGESAPPLNTLIEALPDAPDRIYLHDLALHPETRGGGHTRTIVERLVEQARGEGWPQIALVAVNDAADFWARMGFSAADTPSLKAKLASYGDDACYMVMPL